MEDEEEMNHHRLDAGGFDNWLWLFRCSRRPFSKIHRKSLDLSNLRPANSKYSVNPPRGLAFSRSGGYSQPTWTMDRHPYFVSPPCGARSRNWLTELLVRQRIPCCPNPFVRLRLFPKAPVQFARGWSRSSRRFVKPPTGKPCTAELFSARLNSKSRTNGSRRCSVFASSNSSGARPRPPQRRLRRPRMRPTPAHRRDGREASNAVGPVRSAAIIPTSPTLSKTRSFRSTSAAARSVVSPSPISQVPRIPPSWRSTSGPIAASFAAAVIDPPARVPLIPASSRPRRHPG